MPNLLQTIKSFGLTEFYFSLSVADKENFARYSRYLVCPPESTVCSPVCESCFVVKNGAQLLWASAANAIPEKKLDFARRLLNHALSISGDDEDTAWIHANLAQVYYENHKLDREAVKKSIHHCHELIKMGFMKSWAHNMIEEMSVFHV